MSKHWSKLVHDLEPYLPGEQPQDQRYVKLNTNENPYPPAPGVARCLAEFDADELRRYPDPESSELIEALAGYHGLSTDQVFVGNGSDEVLAHAFQALFKRDLPILFPDISYSFYPVYCALYEIDYRQIALDDDFRIDLDGYRADNGGIVIANPNAPSGIALGLAEIRQLLADNPESAVIVDEAYVDFGAESALPLIAEFDNLLVVRSFSKSRSLAGLRLGYALGQAALIEGLQRIKNSFNSYPIDRLACRLGIASIDDEAYFRQSVGRVIATRERVAGELERLGFGVFPSSANFVFARAPGGKAENLYLDLKAAGILVRYFDRPRIDDCLRISIGSDEECDALIAALTKMLD
ncbi:MAG: histidinol-phosphate transaminase [Gammaproteobacteria bacterium]|jgi:histidinol-phosphate aminotransferase